LKPLAPDKLFLENSFFFRNISKNVRDIDIGKVYRIKFLGLLSCNNLLAGRILISPTVFEIQEFEKSEKKTPPMPNFGEILPRIFCPALSLDSQLREIF